LLLISSDFLASEYCHQVELKRAIERHEKGDARVIPIILRPCRWQSAWFSKLQLLPKNGEPVTKWADRDDAFTNIVEGIERAIGEMIRSAAAPVAPPPKSAAEKPLVELRSTKENPTTFAELEEKYKVKKPLVELHSAKGIDYRELEKLLKAQEWRSADELTGKHMLKVANRESQGWLDEDSIKIFPCEDLRTIDQLWVHYSNSKFGFSIQKKLWLDCGGEIGKHDVKVWMKFAATVGWYHPENDDWRAYTDFMNDTNNAQNAPPFSLPVWWGFVRWGVGGWGERVVVGSLLSRRDL
jgi:molybdopterin converting factor small subunit